MKGPDRYADRHKRADRDLLERACAGERDAVDAVLRAHVERIHAVCRRLCHDRLDAEDAAQEALIAVTRGLQTFDGRSSLSTWIFRVTTNSCLDELRRIRRRPAPIDTTADSTDRHRSGGSPVRQSRTDDPAESVVRSEQRAELALALSELTEEFRVAVVLRDVADLEYSQIAEITGVSIGTVRSRIARGRGRLADSLGTSGTEREHSSSEQDATIEEGR